jgi:acyl carrier protein
MSPAPVDVIRGFIVQNYLFDDTDALPSDDTSLLDRGIIDSTGVLDLILFTEETFGISVADEDVTPENFDSISRVAAYIQAKRAA